MKINLKKLSIFGLVAVFLISAFLCCCFTNTVEAQEPTPSCHQTTHGEQPSQETNECECDQTLATFKEATFLKNLLMQVTYVSVADFSNNIFYVVSEINAYQAPPMVYETSPLYIKHSILRV